MRVNRLWLFRSAFAGVFSFLIITTGCSSTGWVPQWSGSGFIRKEFLDYKKVAVLPFKGDTRGEASDAFAESLHEKFPQVALFEQKQLLEIFEEQDLYPGKLNESTRRRVGKVLGVEALVMGDVYYPSILRWLLQVQIVAVETGEVMGRSFVEINYMGAEGVKGACKIAVQNLTLR
jgi:hypothetical protein